MSEHSSAAPLITIGITCFNAETTISKAIESALTQNYPNIEIVIVDDCSSDKSREVIQDVVAKYDNACLISHTENMGVAAARNTIINNAQGDFIAFFDDDDVSLSERVTVQFKRITSYEEETRCKLLACWASGYKQYENGYKAPFQAIGSQPQIPIGRDIIEYQLYMGRNQEAFFGSGTPSCSLMVRTPVLKEIGLYDTQMRRIEDTDFALRLAGREGHFIGCPEILVIQSASVGADKSPEVGYETELSVIEKHKELFETPRRYDYAKAWAKLRYHHFGQKQLDAILTLCGLFIKYPKWTWEQFWRSAPKRILHERKMKNTKYKDSRE